MVNKAGQVVRTAGQLPASQLRKVGHQAEFYVRAYLHIYRVLVRYRRELLRQLTTVSFGAGGLALVGGTVVIVSILTASAGIEAGQQSFHALNAIGVDALTGFITGYINVRLGAPLIAGVALVSTVGAGFTAEIAAQRISEEIDALEVMAVPSIPFLVTTRILAGVIAIIPLYAVALFAGFGVTRLLVVIGFGQSPGTYDHYFSTFLVPKDVLFSFLEIILIVVVVMSIHTYYGYHASGGPAGVGQAVGRAVRLAIIFVMVTALAASLVLYGTSDSVHLSR
ncbi:MAG: phospholipid/cholesterol/gamma-HCH transport system permease protein [Pseudonocardiales bacterium]|jgi:phospholipid/cholesterol/gamma-HCH transport system permease protein|nr:phospholipid/cholesterol/gamma-HCH transport system permease protein [Pseudonocardiales bacterium]